jgi:glyceraldehyde 3-phosphate dehydrogenase
VGSLIDLVCELEREASAEAVNAAFRESASETLGYTEEELVSADYVGDDHGGVVDGRLTMVIGSMAKVLAWYDNEAGFTHQLLRTLRLVASGMGR